MTEDELAELVLRHLRAMYAQLRTPIATGLLTRQLLRVTPRERFTAHRVGRVLTALEAQGLGSRVDKHPTQMKFRWEAS